MMAVQRFPNLKHQKRDDDNPAIQMFGRRFHKDQTPVEYLAEFLLVFNSRKQIDDAHWNWERGFPSSEALQAWPDGKPLRYVPPARLTLKLFTFLGSSILETRHECHKTHFRKVIHELQSKVETTAAFTRGQVLDLLEQLLTGFTGVAKSRTWCAHTFLPITPGLIAREAIWEHTRAVRVADLEWEEALDGNYFDFSKHAFMARGGEVLYLQLCNLFKRIDEDQLGMFESDLEYTKGTACTLKERIESGFNKLFESTSALNGLAEWIGNADKGTRDRVDEGTSKSATCGWCPAESWREAYLFAYEMANICDALIDPLEKIELLKLCNCSGGT